MSPNPKAWRGCLNSVGGFAYPKLSWWAGSCNERRQPPYWRTMSRRLRVRGRARRCRRVTSVPGGIICYHQRLRVSGVSWYHT